MTDGEKIATCEETLCVEENARGTRRDGTATSCEVNTRDKGNGFCEETRGDREETPCEANPCDGATALCEVMLDEVETTCEVNLGGETLAKTFCEVKPGVEAETSCEVKAKRVERLQ